eukprot:TRINITY_DN9554_c0_g1_i2.p2 TRINITY_DN9554_c0_g1~~TRINITY_DN9554_c0_g1_i2.p2  ORF type:complete len:131 (+),score=32.00 TRINITY_DN9554_c0_g1_i2:50-442(+)
MKTSTMVALPLAAWLLWDTAGMWLPEDRWFPVISYFRRQWKKSPAKQMMHMKMLSDLLIFALIAYQVIVDKDDANSIRGASVGEKRDIDRGLEQVRFLFYIPHYQMMQSDLESHAKCMDTLLVKHKIAME